jgi:uncharacterized membrane-anchored protein
MFPSFNKLAVVVAVILALWYGLRWLNRAPSNLMRRRPEPAPQGPAGNAAIEDLVACGACGTFVATSARACGKPDCPQPR